jgi:DNA invertase Pin-like site-specific DNA recombinase
MSTWDNWDALISGADPDPIEVLAVSGRYERYLAEVQRRAVRAARASGRTWQEIGAALGVRRQAVWQRFREQCERSGDWPAQMSQLEAWTREADTSPTSS